MLLLLACQADPAREATGGASANGGVHSDGDLPESVPGTAVDEPESDDRPADGEVCQATLDCPDGLVEEIKTECHLSITRQDGTVDYDGIAGTWIRGRSSRYAPKKQYGVELREEDGTELEVPILDMGSESDWILNGQYFDRWLFRGKLGFDLFRDFDKGRYAPESRFCELTLDGAYVGLYLLMERIKRDGSRVDIAKSDSGDSFVLKMDDEDCFYSPDTLPNCWKLVYPNEHTITEAQADGVTAWERGLDMAARSADPYGAGGMWEWTDEDAMVDIVLLEEFVKNEDFLWTSLHSWKDVGGLIQYTPWDFDLAFGCLENYSRYGDPNVWIEFRPELFAVAGYSEEFRSRLAQRWSALRDGPMAEEAIVARIDAYTATAREALDRNFSLWDISTVNYGSYCYTVYSWEEEDARVRAWIHDRLVWMDANVGAW